MKHLILICIGLLFSFSLTAQKIEADDILGQYWINNKDGKIKIFKRGEKYFGKILWRKEVRKDVKNPDKSLRNRSIIGIEFLKDFVFNGQSQWEEGSVYSIENGRTYRGKIWLENQGKTLKMRGYWGVSWIGKTISLSRIE